MVAVVMVAVGVVMMRAGVWLLGGWPAGLLLCGVVMVVGGLVGVDIDRIRR